MAFHDVRFPLAISNGATGGPERRTDVVVLGSGREQRNQRWADSRRKYDAGLGIRTLDELHQVLIFFEERRGRLHGFRWRDASDYRSCAPNVAVSATDQAIGVGDGTTDEFRIVKTYGGAYSPYVRGIVKPVAGTVRIAVSGVEVGVGVVWTVDTITGIVTFDAGHIPTVGQAITAGYEFDVPARFDTDELTINMRNFAEGELPQIAVVEIRL